MPYPNGPRATELKPKNVAFWAFVLVSMVAIVVGYVYVQNRAVPDSEYVSSYSATAVAPAADEVRAVVIGDAYAAGAGADSPERGYAHLLGQARCWATTVLGQAGTGYTVPATATDATTPFVDRVEDAIAAQPDVVIVQGSTIDPGGITQEQAATELFTQLTSALPDTKIVAVGPAAAPGVNAATVRASRDAVAAGTEAAGVTFVDPATAEWLAPTEYDDNGVLPNQQGHSTFAAKLGAELDSLGVLGGC
ncbi:SGNH/GDSL hydrolase family protein [Rhodococcus sp. HNM0569]|uniref:SGNH/GDSL hydrolase family protein n=1 Tax=Rhodococcus sp. HNM0569 TaxID=2716340 RepID=UPI00146B6F8D|nr:SGNH/GDSL hydrolase family protein [Rhodococcus sp. HNM0569]NLU83600.1 SGNH/GDSL hydrolase family protein [Rhodococcus sp. HNM0569]